MRHWPSWLYVSYASLAILFISFLFLRGDSIAGWPEYVWGALVSVCLLIASFAWGCFAAFRRMQ